MRHVLGIFCLLLAAAGCASDQVIETTSLDLSQISTTSESTTTQPAPGTVRPHKDAVVCDGLAHELRVVDTQAHLIHRFDVDNPDSWKAEMTEFGLLQPTYFNEGLDLLNTLSSSLDDSYRIAIETYRRSMTLVEEGQWTDLEQLVASPTYLDLLATIDGGLTDYGC